MLVRNRFDRGLGCPQNANTCELAGTFSQKMKISIQVLLIDGDNNRMKAAAISLELLSSASSPNVEITDHY